VTTTVLVADDHAPTRAGVRLALEADGFLLCAEASDAAGAVRGARDHAPDVCLLDVNMPGGGIAAARAIAELRPAPAIVMLTVSRADDDLFEALRAGASGYLLKDVPAAGLADALRDVLAGEAVLSVPLVSRVVDEFRNRGRRSPRRLLGGGSVDLTDREWQILELLHAGCSTAEVAERLFVAPVTVRTHVAAIVRKLRVPDRRAAIELLDER
jgi:DNA-binding NarL/FixJ family response regulator